MNKFVSLLLILFFGAGCAFSSEIIKDNFIDNILLNREVKEPHTNLDYNYSDVNSVEIPLNVVEKVSTGGKNKVYEGQKLTFVVEKDVFYQNKLILKQGTIVKGRVKNILTRGFAGIPAEIHIGNIEIFGFEKEKFSEISAKGFNATLWILPVKWALTFLPPFGSITNLAIGGNAVLRPFRTVSLYYYPD